MKSLKSLLAVTCIVLLSAGCASVTDATLPEQADHDFARRLFIIAERHFLAGLAKRSGEPMQTLPDSEGGHS